MVIIGSEQLIFEPSYLSTTLKTPLKQKKLAVTFVKPSENITQKTTKGLILKGFCLFLKEFYCIFTQFSVLGICNILFAIIVKYGPSICLSAVLYFITVTV